MTLQHYQNQSDLADLPLLEEDAVTYAVLIAIMQQPCTGICTNHQSVIIAFSRAPFPVWVWVEDPACDEDVDAVAACLKRAFPAEAGHTYNLSEPLWDRLKERDPYFRTLGVKMGLLSYRLDRINEMDRHCDGEMVPAGEADMDYLIALWRDMCLEMTGNEYDEAYCRDRVTAHMAGNNLFTWRNAAGEIVAIASRADTGRYSKVGSVYTVPHQRRKGYAINLVHRISGLILADGLTPILYTDAAYSASNGCYQKIGYQKVGSLCTLANME